MKNLNRKNIESTAKLPIKVVQFGEGNFLRAFVDYLIEKLNEQAGFNAGLAVVQPLPKGTIPQLNEQDGLYSLFLKGIKNGEKVQQKRIIQCIQKAINPYEDYEEYLRLAEEEELEFIISNTTEAGIAYDENDSLDEIPHNSYPAKLTALLYRRFRFFKGNEKKGLTIIPCELINYNADTLKKIILQYADKWELGEAFIKWINNSNSFHNTLVDRIVPGYPKKDIESYYKELGFKDKLIATAEVFLLWVIEGGSKLKEKIPFDKIDENILIVDDMQPYRSRKVRILNGAHTSMVPFSLMYGNRTVRETLENDFTGNFIEQLIFDEIIPTLSLEETELKAFAVEVLERFKNPFIEHQLSSIALNSVSKFKVRVLPSLLVFQEKKKELPVRITYALACLIRFYKGEWREAPLPLNDDNNIVEYFKMLWDEKKGYEELASTVLQKTDFWGQDLSLIPNLNEKLAEALELIDQKGIEKGFESFSKSKLI